MGYNNEVDWNNFKKLWPGKFESEDEIFSRVHPGARIFIGTACAEPQYLVRTFINYIQSHPHALFDAELIHVWSLGITPYTDERFRDNFRLNSFFIGNSIRDAVNSARADYTPLSLSTVPDLFRKGMIPLDIALVQTSLPDEDGKVSLGISVDIIKAAVESSSIVVAQINSHMPFVRGDGIISMEDLDFIVPRDEPLLEYGDAVPGDMVQRIGRHVARIVEDGATIQVGYGSIPNAVIANLGDKKHLGLHSELFSDGVAELMRRDVIDNSRKTVDPGLAVASFCMGRRDTYEFLDRNSSVEFRSIDYTNDPLVIARQRGMTAINSCLEIDLTGQATAESLGGAFYAGIGGQTDFMRGALLAPRGRTILALPSTSRDGRFSRITPRLNPGAGVTLNRSDVRYVVTEYGIAYLHGKNIRERAMDLISIAHPKFRPWLIDEAKKQSLIFKDQAFVPGEYPEALETCKITRTGLRILLRPVKISDEPLLKDFFYSLSDKSMYLRFASARKDMPHQRLQEFVAVDYTRNMVILALVGQEENYSVVGLGQYIMDEKNHTAEVALVVRDNYQGQGVGRELQAYLTYLARKSGLLGFTAEVLENNEAALSLLKNMGYEVVSKEGGTYDMKLAFG
jgi:acyl-CoA hydrolase/ribosomal protein S18 acetylase RimI-like enzyme